VTASGTERHLFENTLVVRLRRGGGHIHEQRVETAAAERWSTQFRYPRTRRRTGTLEAVASSALDGTLDCLVQVRVRFGG
jgi:Immunoglobulin-like domain of bacterial spore germination